MCWRTILPSHTWSGGSVTPGIASVVKFFHNGYVNLHFYCQRKRFSLPQHSFPHLFIAYWWLILPRVWPSLGLICFSLLTKDIGHISRLYWPFALLLRAAWLMDPFVDWINCFVLYSFFLILSIIFTLILSDAYVFTQISSCSIGCLLTLLNFDLATQKTFSFSKFHVSICSSEPFISFSESSWLSASSSSFYFPRLGQEFQFLHKRCGSILILFYFIYAECERGTQFSQTTGSQAVMCSVWERWLSTRQGGIHDLQSSMVLLSFLLWFPLVTRTQKVQTNFFGCPLLVPAPFAREAILHPRFPSRIFAQNQKPEIWGFVWFWVFCSIGLCIYLC